MAAMLGGYGDPLVCAPGSGFAVATAGRSGGLLGGFPAGAFPIMALRLFRSSDKSAADRASGSDGPADSGGEDGELTPRGRAEPSAFLAVRPVGGPTCRGWEPRDDPGLLRSCTSDGTASGSAGAGTTRVAGSGCTAPPDCGATATAALWLAWVGAAEADASRDSCWGGEADTASSDGADFPGGAGGGDFPGDAGGADLPNRAGGADLPGGGDLPGEAEGAD
mmetsp:Transcript_38464/g.86285  ORF Transcript_38464/g.86285 Transcript_38464/m.86285 type:complete len:222 (-) Transcript_38464:1773-2438(-)